MPRPFGSTASAPEDPGAVIVHSLEQFHHVARRGSEVEAKTLRFSVPPSDSPPDCPHCRASIAESARLRRLELSGDEGQPAQAFIVVYCEACGWSLAFRPVTE